MQKDNLTIQDIQNVDYKYAFFHYTNFKILKALLKMASCLRLVRVQLE